jgi:hypothetical protein
MVRLRFRARLYLTPVDDVAGLSVPNDLAHRSARHGHAATGAEQQVSQPRDLQHCGARKHR